MSTKRIMMASKTNQNNIWSRRKNTLIEFLKNRLIIPTLGFIHILELDEIKYIKASSNYSIIYYAEDKSIISSKTLKYYEECLQNKGFLRVHSNTLINLTKIKGIGKNGIYTIILKDNTNIPVSRSYKEALFANLF